MDGRILIDLSSPSPTLDHHAEGSLLLPPISAYSQIFEDIKAVNMKFPSYFSGRLWQETLPQPQTSIFDAIEWRGTQWPPAHGTQNDKGKDTSSVDHLLPPP
jgi:hypothetical protein